MMSSSRSTTLTMKRTDYKTSLLHYLTLICLHFLLVLNTQSAAGSEIQAVGNISSLKPSNGLPNIPCVQRTHCNSIGLNREDPSGDPLPFYARNCFCDEPCSLYGDCCADYSGQDSGRGLGKKRGGVSGVTCQRVEMIDTSYEIYIVTSCPAGYDDEFVRGRCEDENISPDDLFLRLPVTDPTTGILYRNIYCAICSNKDTQVEKESFLYWIPLYTCDVPASSLFLNDVTDKMTYAELRGVTSYCRLEIQSPPMSERPRKCKSNIDSCSRKGRTDSKISKKCRNGPSAYVYHRLQVYKNRFCAQCNGIEASDVQCEDGRTPWIEFDSGLFSSVELDESESTQFNPRPDRDRVVTLSIDVAAGTGNLSKSTESDKIVKLGEGCPGVGWVLDPFYLECRRVGCEPGWVFINGDCAIDPNYVPPTTTTTTTTPTTTTITTATTTTTTQTTTNRKTTKTRTTTTSTVTAGTTTTTATTTVPKLKSKSTKLLGESVTTKKSRKTTVMPPTTPLITIKAKKKLGKQRLTTPASVDWTGEGTTPAEIGPPETSMDEMEKLLDFKFDTELDNQYPDNYGYNLAQDKNKVPNFPWYEDFDKVNENMEQSTVPSAVTKTTEMLSYKITARPNFSDNLNYKNADNELLTPTSTLRGDELQGFDDEELGSAEFFENDQQENFDAETSEYIQPDFESEKKETENFRDKISPVVNNNKIFILENKPKNKQDNTRNTGSDFRMKSDEKIVVKSTTTTTVVPVLHEQNDTAKHMVVFQYQSIESLIAYIAGTISICATFGALLSVICSSSKRIIMDRRIIGSLALSLLICQIFYILALITNYSRYSQTLDEIFCFCVAALLHYIFLVSFLWVNILTIDLCRSVCKHTSNSDKTSASCSSGTRFIFYSLHVTITPLILVLSGVMFDLYKVDFLFRPRYADSNVCWITGSHNQLILFAAPLVTVTLVDSVLFIITAHRLCASAVTSHYDVRRYRKCLLLCVGLCVCICATWMCAFGSAFFAQQARVGHIAFILLNASQGLIVCCMALNLRAPKSDDNEKDIWKADRYKNGGKKKKNSKVKGDGLGAPRTEILSQETSF